MWSNPAWSPLCFFRLADCHAYMELNRAVADGIGLAVLSSTGFFFWSGLLDTAGWIGSTRVGAALPASSDLAHKILVNPLEHRSADWWFPPQLLCFVLLLIGFVGLRYLELGCSASTLHQANISKSTLQRGPHTAPASQRTRSSMGSSLLLAFLTPPLLLAEATGGGSGSVFLSSSSSSIAIICSLMRNYLFWREVTK